MRMCFTLIGLLPLLLATGSCSRVPRDQISSAEFASTALPLLPIEQPYDFHKALSEGLAPRQRDRNAQPTPEEMALSAQGWILIMHSDAGIALRQGVEELRVYLQSAMDVYLSVETRGSLAGWQNLQNTIVAGSRSSFSIADPPSRGVRIIRSSSPRNALLFAGLTSGVRCTVFTICSSA